MSKALIFDLWLYALKYATLQDFLSCRKLNKEWAAITRINGKCGPVINKLWKQYCVNHCHAIGSSNFETVDWCIFYNELQSFMKEEPAAVSFANNNIPNDRILNVACLRRDCLLVFQWLLDLWGVNLREQANANQPSEQFAIRGTIGDTEVLTPVRAIWGAIRRVSSDNTEYRIIKWLLSAPRCDLSFVEDNVFGGTVLIEACHKGLVGLVRDLMNDPRMTKKIINIEAPITAFHYAIRTDAFDVMIEDDRVNVNCATNKGGFNVPIIDLLVDIAGDPTNTKLCQRAIRLLERDDLSLRTPGSFWGSPSWLAKQIKNCEYGECIKAMIREKKILEGLITFEEWEN